MMPYIEMYFIFFKTGLFTIGGGLAAIPLLLEVTQKNQWLTEEMFYHMVAISQSTPGPIGINLATYIGYDQFGVIGSLIATAGMISPSIIIIILISKFFLHFNQKSYVQAAFYGLRPAVTGLIATAAFNILAIIFMPTNASSITGPDFTAINALLFIIIFTLYVKFQKHPIFYIILGAILGIIFL